MAKKCKKCSENSITGINDVPAMEMMMAVVATVGAKKIDEALTTNVDGTPKEGYLADNQLARNAMYVGLGVLLTSYMSDEFSKGAGIGLAAFGGANIINNFLAGMQNPQTPSTGGLYGVVQVPPRNIAGMVGPTTAAPRIVVTADGVSPSNIAGSGLQNAIMESQEVNGLESGL